MKNMYKITPEVYTVEELVKQFDKETKMKVDKKFQRKVVWDNDQKRRYYESVGRGAAASSLVVADIRSGLEASRRIGDASGVVEYSKLWKDGDGFTTISLDGQNRIASLWDLLNNKQPFKGDLFDLDGNPVHINNKKFKDWPADVRNQFKKSIILVTVIKGAPYCELPRLFLDLNDGEPLNRAEKRNSFPSPIADFIRNATQGSTKDFWKEVSTVYKKIDRMADIETLTKIIMHLNSYTWNWSLRDDSMDKFYKLGMHTETGAAKDIKKVKQYASSELDHAMSVFKLVQTICTQRQGRWKKDPIAYKTLWAVIFACEHIKARGHVVLDPGRFYDKVSEIDEMSRVQSRTQQDVDRKTKMKEESMTEEEADKACPDTDYYWKWQKSSDDPHRRRKRSHTLRQELEARLPSYAGIVQLNTSLEKDAA